MKILLVKLGALGDVLRTTPLLTALKAKYPASKVHWIVEAGSVTELKSAIQSAFLKRGHLSEMGAAAARAVQGYDWDCYYRRIEDQVSEIWSARNQGRGAAAALDSSHPLNS